MQHYVQLAPIALECLQVLLTATRDRKPTVPEAAPFVRAYRTRNPVGGSLHLVLDDGNVSDANVIYCREHAQAHDDESGMLLAQLLLRMSRTQRSRLGAFA